MSAVQRAADWPVDVVAVGVTGPDATLDTYGAVDTPFPWASVTKPLAAYGFLVAVEQGRIELDEPAGPPGSTVRHLLAHTAGYDFDSDTILSEPGRRRIYSNTGFEVLGRLVEERIGRPFSQYLRAQVLLPLGMSDTVLEGSPAKDATGTLSDLLRFARELLRPTVLPEDLVAEATSVAFEGRTGVLPGHGRQEHNDWGLGFEIRDHKEPHWTGSRNSPATFGHFGQSGSFVWIDPELDLGCAALGDRPYGGWAAEAWPPFSDAVIEEHGG